MSYRRRFLWVLLVAGEAIRLTEVASGLAQAQSIDSVAEALNRRRATATE